MAWIKSAIAIGAAGSIYGGIEATKSGIRAQGAVKAQGITQQKMHNFEAQQYDQAAKAQTAVGIRNAQEELRKSKLVQSRALAVAGASGAGASDPNITKIMSDIAAEGQLAAETHLFNGNEAARGLRLNATVARWQGEQARKGAAVQAAQIGDQIKSQQLQTVLQVAGSAAAWAGRGPSNTTATTSGMELTRAEGAKLTDTNAYGEITWRPD